MTLKTYQGATMAEALAKVKRDLGAGAVILQTRTIRQGGLLGLGGREVVEITASGDVNVLPPASRRVGPAAARANLARMFGGQAPSRPTETPRPSEASRQADESPLMKQELTAIRDMVADLVRESRSARMGEMPEALFNAYLDLLKGEVAEEIARQIVGSVRDRLTGEKLADQRVVREALTECISRMIPTGGPVRLGGDGTARVVALIGPTGVGKTTTVAKLAANFKLRENRRVALITIDTYRIAAVSQLATYAQIIDVPLRVVVTPSQLADAVAEFRPTCDVVLIDTAGRSPTDAMKLNELRGFLAAARPHETHLVLSSTCNASALRSAAERFASLGVDHLILTKLDEAVGFGVVLDVVKRVNAAVSYVTTGQDVPDDIEVGSAARLARWIVNRSLAEDEGRTPQGRSALDVTVAEPAMAGARGQGGGDSHA